MDPDQPRSGASRSQPVDSRRASGTDQLGSSGRARGWSKQGVVFAQSPTGEIRKRGQHGHVDEQDLPGLAHGAVQRPLPRLVAGKAGINAGTMGESKFSRSSSNIRSQIARSIPARCKLPAHRSEYAPSDLRPVLRREVDQQNEVRNTFLRVAAGSAGKKVSYPSRLCSLRRSRID
jgi:hypothetical protein